LYFVQSLVGLFFVRHFSEVTCGRIAGAVSRL